MTSSLNPVPDPVPAKNPLATTTFWGGALAGVSTILSDWRNPITWAQGVGIIVSAWGVRKAISKNGMGA